MKKSRELIIISITIVLSVILPFAFHFIKAGGQIFLPMYYPAVIAGFLLQPFSAGLSGFLSPFVSSFLTGMPPLNPPIAFQMSIELSILSLSISFLYNKFKFNYYIVIICAMFFNRIVFIFLTFILSIMYKLPFKSMILSQILVSMPGFFVIVLILPAISKIIKNKIFSSDEIYNE